MPRGAFGAQFSRPDRDIPTVALALTVVANKTLRGSAVYANVQLLTEQFSRGTGSSSTGTVPW